MAARPAAAGPAGRHLGQEVKRLRGLLGWEQSTLVAALATAGASISQPVLSRIEAGDRRVDVDDLLALADALGVPASALLPGQGEQVRFEVARAVPAREDEGAVGAALAEDIEALGDLVGMEPTLAATAARLARQIDGQRPVPCDECGALVHVPADPRTLPQLTRELRATVAALLEGRAVDDDDEDDLGDLGSA